MTISSVVRRIPLIRFPSRSKIVNKPHGAPASATSVTGTDMKASTSARADSESANRPMSSGTPTQKVGGVA